MVWALTFQGQGVGIYVRGELVFLPGDHLQGGHQDRLDQQRCGPISSL